MRLAARPAAAIALLFAANGQLWAAEPQTPAPPVPADAAKLEYFESKVRPLLVEHCLDCHSHESELSGNLSLDSAADWSRGGDSGPAVVPGDPAASLLIRAVRYADAALEMPPDGQLSPADVKLLERWVHEGAFDPRTPLEADPAAAEAVPRGKAPVDIERLSREHWAYRPRDASPPPRVDGSLQSAIAGPIDAFVVASLATAFPTSSEYPADELLSHPADAAAMVRRLYADLYGLPPQPAVVQEAIELPPGRRDAFLVELADRLIASPRFGERFARHWMDVARYGESLTLRGLLLPGAWRYRDYLIESFNADVPYDRFVAEQLAGDLLPPAGPEEEARRRVAMSYLLLSNANLEEQDKRQLEMDIVDEQIDTLGKGLLGQTFGCARCHDHKFDPIPTRDYYALAGVFESVRTVRHANVSASIAADLPLPQAERARYESLRDRIAELKEQTASLEKRLAGSVDPAAVDPASLPGLVLDDTQARKVGNWVGSNTVKPFVGEGYVYSPPGGQAGSITFEPAGLEPGTYEVRLAYQPHPNRAKRAEVIVASAGGEASTRLDQRQMPPEDGLWISLGEHRFEAGGQAYVLVNGAAADGAVIADAVQFIKAGAEAVAPAQVDVGGDSLALRAELVELKSELKRAEEEYAARPQCLGFDCGEPADLAVHVRGSVHSLGEVVPRGVPQFISGAVGLPPAPADRLAVARWMTAPDHPLTARVYVNRVWGWLLGTPLVASADNFGTTGTPPTHPELLDHLAEEFVRHGWSTKWLVREIVSSDTYRRSGSRTAAQERFVAAGGEASTLAERYASRPPRRVTGEMIRDAILASSGWLELTAGGPSYEGKLADDYNYMHRSVRRSVYLPAFRNSVHPVLAAFDAADPSTVVGVRDESTVVTQALLLLRDPWVGQRAREAASRSAVEYLIDPSATVEDFYLSAVGRKPSPDELAAMIGFVDETAGLPPGHAQRPTFDVYLEGFQSATFHVHPASPKEVVRWIRRRAAVEGALAEAFQAVYASIDFRYVP